MMLIKGLVSEWMAEGAMYEGFYDGSRIMFQVPVYLMPGDELALDVRYGQPMAVFRPGLGVIWAYEPERERGVKFTLVGQWDGDREVLDKLFSAD